VLPCTERIIARSSANAFFVLKLAPKPLLVIRNVSASFMPLGRFIVSMR